MFAWPFRCTITHSLLLFGLDGKGGKRKKGWLPMPLAKVFGNIVQVSYGPWAWGLSIELLGGLYEVTRSIQLVCTFNLTQGMLVHSSGKVKCNVLRQSQGQGHLMVGSKALGLQLGQAPWYRMRSSSLEAFPGLDLTGKRHASSIQNVQRRSNIGSKSSIPFCTHRLRDGSECLLQHTPVRWLGDHHLI